MRSLHSLPRTPQAGAALVVLGSMFCVSALQAQNPSQAVEASARAQLEATCDPQKFAEAKKVLLSIVGRKIAVATDQDSVNRLVQERDELRAMTAPTCPTTSIMDEMGPVREKGLNEPVGDKDLNEAAFRIIAGMHNKERAALNLPPLQWDPALAAAASGWAVELARTGHLGHAPREGRGIARENVSKGLVGWSQEEMIASWLDEKRNLVPGVFPNVSRTGNWYDVGHYSQIVWPETTHIGCGMATGSGYQWLVCRYSPGGNKDGKQVGYMQTPQIAAADFGGTTSGNGPPGTLIHVNLDRACTPWIVFQEGQLSSGAVKYLQTPAFSRGILNETVAHIDATIVGDEYGWRMPWAENSFNTDTYKIEGELAPIPDIRGSYNGTVRAPNVVELFFPQASGRDCR